MARFDIGWTSGLPETPCGSGSTLAATRAQREWIPAIVKQYGIRSVADIGAGDLNWIRHMGWQVDYTAYDLVPRSHGVKQFDLLQQVPPKVDMVMCLWVLNHLNYADCEKAITNLLKSGARYLMITDRPAWRAGQPPQMNLDALEELVLNAKTGDRLILAQI